MALPEQKATNTGRSRVAALGALLLGCIGAGAGCIAPTGRGQLEAYPFFAYNEDFDADGDGVSDGFHFTLPIAGFAYSDGLGRGPEGDPEGERDEARFQVFYPIGEYEREGDDVDFTFFPRLPIVGEDGVFAIGGSAGSRILPGLLYYVNRGEDEEQSGDDDTDFGALPFFLAGSDSTEGGYLTVFPFGGNMKGLLGKDDAIWVGFPYPLYLWLRDKGFYSHHVLFPFFNYVHGDGHRGGRFFPFLGYYERDAKAKPDQLSYWRLHFLWPFFTIQKNNIDTGDPVHVFIITPLFGRVASESGDLQEYSFLFPFFKYRAVEKRSKTGQILGAKTDYWELRAPFPFFIVGSGPQQFRFDLWPLFGYKSRDYGEPARETRRFFFLWPIFRSESEEDETYRYDRFFALPFFWTSAGRPPSKVAVGVDDGEDPDADWRKVNVWPFFHYRRKEDGAMDIHALSPFYWEDQERSERIYYPFFRLFHFNRTAKGAETLRLLFGLYSSHEAPALPEENVPERVRRSFLFGLFQYRRDGGERAIRLFWLPEIRWGEVGEEWTAPRPPPPEAAVEGEAGGGAPREGRDDDGRTPQWPARPLSRRGGPLLPTGPALAAPAADLAPAAGGAVRGRFAPDDAPSTRSARSGRAPAPAATVGSAPDAAPRPPRTVRRTS